MATCRIVILVGRSVLAAIFTMIFTMVSYSQNAYFVDGYHGGIYGHYPDNYTQFLVDMFNKNPDWKISLEIEPETWDSVKVKNADAYKAFRDLVLSPLSEDRIEFTNPGYGQGYLYNISGESVIRQFTYGIDKLNEHFPGVTFVTYAVEEPCFTSCLPQVLKSFGFKYAVIRCPNTCWGGYPKAFGGELVNWIGPDGTELISVPRYACEGLQENSVWQTKSWNNSVEFIDTCFSSGIQHPVGMTYQDAGWKGGPWLGNAVKEYYKPTVFDTWRHYIENVVKKPPEEDWKFSQEDLQVSLVWGSQILQKLAQRVRISENKIVAAEKMASIAGVYQGLPWPKTSLDEAWRTLLLSGHHDCWIVPYNGKVGNTWADKVAVWTGATNQACGIVIQESILKLSQGTASRDKYIRVFNTTGYRRSEFVGISLPEAWGVEVKVMDDRDKDIISQVVTDPLSNAKTLIFKADIPPMGYNTYQVKMVKPSVKTGAKITVQADGTYKMETDLYKITVDPAKGGTIKSIIAKTLKNKEFVDQSDKRGFNELRGNFYKDGGSFSGTQNQAAIRILENGPALVRLEIKGEIATHPFTQVITLAQGQRRIDFSVKIDWKGNPGIGNEYSQTTDWKQTDRRKAFYNNRDKLLTLFPLNLSSPKVYINAPFDVTESKHDNTFFTSWDSIKNDIVLNWVDITDAANSYGMALLTDHTTSYAHGSDFPPGLTIQYSGIGLWGRNYNITGPTEVNYALIPHTGKWDKSRIWTEGTFWNEPLLATVMNSKPETGDIRRSLIDVSGTGLEISSVTYEGGDLLVRIFNAEGDNGTKILSFDGKAVNVELVELNGQKVEDVKMNLGIDSRTTIQISFPRFGIRTLKFIGLLPSHLP
jgi:alpha-mannosidase